MPAVNVVRTSWGRRTSAGNMGVQVEGRGQVYTLYSTPVEGTYGPGVQEVAETPRPGMKTLSHPRGPGLRSYQFEHKIYHPLPSGNVDTELKFLRALAEEGKRVRFFNTGALGMDTWYWVTECKITEEEKGAGHHTSRATVSWTVKEAVVFNPVDWTRTAFKDQPPIKIEAKGPELPATTTDGDSLTPGNTGDGGTVKNDRRSGAVRGGAIGAIIERAVG